jgi:hypothetical protein
MGMNDPDDQSLPGATSRFPTRAFGFILLLFSLTIGYLLLFRGVEFFVWITERLPLLLPLAVTVMSIATRATDIRSYEAVLKTSNDIAIGIISFDIWLLSARSAQSNQVFVNSRTIIRGDFAIAFLVLGLVVAVGSLILTHYDFVTQQGKQRALLTGFVFAALVYVAPFGVLEPVKTQAPAPTKPTVAMRRFGVAIPYDDPGARSYASGALAKLRFAHFESNIMAPSPEEAKAQATKNFLASSDSNQVKSISDKKGRVPGEKKVALDENGILVAETAQ